MQQAQTLADTEKRPKFEQQKLASIAPADNSAKDSSSLPSLFDTNVGSAQSLTTSSHPHLMAAQAPPPFAVAQPPPTVMGGGPPPPTGLAGAELGDGMMRVGKSTSSNAVYHGPLDHAHEQRIIIPSSQAGAIIGKAGAYITQLRDTHKVRIDMPDAQAPERVVCITSQERDFTHVLNVLREILPVMAKSVGKSDSDTNAAADKKDEYNPDETPHQLRLLVHQSHAGYIIGKGGSVIKELREKNGVQIKVYPTCAPMSTDRVCSLTGKLESVLSCLQAINTILKDTPVKGISKMYDTINYDSSYANDYGGLISTARKRPSEQNVGNYASPWSFQAGYPRATQAAPGHAYAAYAAPPPAPGAYGQSFMPPRAAYGGGGGGGGYMGGGPSATMQVSIPPELAGLIIGRGGERIESIRQDSQARVLVEPQMPGASERVISITGTKPQREMAQYLLQQCVRASPHGRQYLGE